MCSGTDAIFSVLGLKKWFVVNLINWSFHISFKNEITTTDQHLKFPGSCSPQEVIIQIKYGSYPAVNPDGYQFPKNFVNPANRESIQTLEMMSDGSNITYSISNPRSGIYYAMAYVKWEDPRNQKVEQEGKVPSLNIEPTKN